jgi:transcription antitermination factor NusG
MSNDLWYALKVRQRSEATAAAALSNKGYEVFLPTYKVRRRWSDRIKIMEFPLFPGYLFCQFDIQRRLPILVIPSINKIVGVGKQPEPVSQSEIDSIRTVVTSGIPCEPYGHVTAGQTVQVEYGALAGLTGIITEVRNHYRLIISVDLLMRSVAVEIDRSWVKPTSCRTVEMRSAPCPISVPRGKAANF